MTTYRGLSVANRDIRKTMFSGFSAGLMRRSLTSCSRYTEHVRVMGPPFPGQWSFTRHPWLREMHDCKAPLWIGQKAAQMGYTETALNLTFYAIDREGKNVLYVLPNKTPDATDFTNARFAPALALSRHLESLFTDINNVGHKRAGNANLYVRGSKSKAGLRSIPVQVIILDEVDVMAQENIPLAMERVSGQVEKAIRMLSTPTIPNFGINKYYEQSDKRQFFFKCPSCSRSINLEFPRNIEITSDDPFNPSINDTKLICHICRNTLPHEGKSSFLADGVWVPSRQSEAAGFYINQLYSPAVRPPELAQKYLLGLKSETGEQEFFNSNLGMPHSVAGSRVTDELIKQAIGEYSSYEGFTGTGLVTMGVDVGKRLHVVIEKWTWEITGRGIKSACQVLCAVTVNEFADLFGLVERFRVVRGVIDMNPERRQARDFVTQLDGMFEMCEYPPGDLGREITAYEDERRIQVDRTAWLDVALGRFRHRGAIRLPADISYEYRENIKALTKFFYRDRQGNFKARYIKGGEEDHFAHARNYSEIAFVRALGTGGEHAGDNPLY